MIRHEKKVIQTPKIGRLGISIHIILILLILAGIVHLWNAPWQPALRELCKIGLAIVDVLLILHLIHRLICNSIWFDENDPEYEKEYIELYPNHIIIYERAQSSRGHKYRYANIYFGDIQFTSFNTKNPKNMLQMKICLRNKQSERSVIKGLTQYDNGSITVQMQGYPESFRQTLVQDYKEIMKAN